MSTCANDAVLVQILSQLNALQVSQQTLQAKVMLPFFPDVRCPHRVSKFDALTTQGSPPHSPYRGNGIPIPGRNGAESIGSPSSPSASLSRAHSVSATPPSSVPQDHPLTDREREKALYPGRVILASEFPVAFEYDVCECMFRAAPVCWHPSVGPVISQTHVTGV